jgi:hypothetical protein
MTCDIVGQKGKFALDPKDIGNHCCNGALPDGPPPNFDPGKMEEWSIHGLHLTIGTGLDEPDVARHDSI